VAAPDPEHRRDHGHVGIGDRPGQAGGEAAAEAGVVDGPGQFDPGEVAVVVPGRQGRARRSGVDAGPAQPLGAQGRREVAEPGEVDHRHPAAELARRRLRDQAGRAQGAEGGDLAAVAVQVASVGEAGGGGEAGEPVEAVEDRGPADQVVRVALGEPVDRLQGPLDRLAADPAEHVHRPGAPVGEAVAAGQQQHLAARLGQAGGAGQPGRAGPDHDDVGPHQAPSAGLTAAASSGTPSPRRSKMPR
jgi:hypothetical protein